MNVDQMLEPVRQHSLLFGELEGLETDRGFEDWLVKLSSRWRNQERLHRIEYRRPEQSDFVLQTDQEPGEAESQIGEVRFREIGRQLTIRVEGLSEPILDGVMAELSILGRAYREQSQNAYEPEYNLLLPAPFKSEVYAEFQRFVRYDTPIQLLRIQLTGDENWKQAARTVKHQTNRRDVIGFIRENCLGLMMVSTDNDDPRIERIHEQLQDQLGSVIELTSCHLPGDTTRWDDVREIFLTSQKFTGSVS